MLPLLPCCSTTGSSRPAFTPEQPGQWLVSLNAWPTDTPAAPSTKALDLFSPPGSAGSGIEVFFSRPLAHCCPAPSLATFALLLACFRAATRSRYAVQREPLGAAFPIAPWAAVHRSCAAVVAAVSGCSPRKGRPQSNDALYKDRDTGAQPRARQRLARQKTGNSDHGGHAGACSPSRKRQVKAPSALQAGSYGGSPRVRIVVVVVATAVKVAWPCT